MDIKWGSVFLGLLLGYLLAMYFPQIGQTVKAKIGG